MVIVLVVETHASFLFLGGVDYLRGFSRQSVQIGEGARWTKFSYVAARLGMDPRLYWQKKHVDANIKWSSIDEEDVIIHIGAESFINVTFFVPT